VSRGVFIDVHAGEVLATLGYIPSVYAAVLAERNIDVLDHHRRGVIKDAGREMPGRRRAQKFVAARLFRYGRKTSGLPKRLRDAQGESFAVEGRDGLLETLEFGGTRSSSQPMAIPLLPRYQGARNAQRWEAKLASGELDVVPGRGLLVETRRGGRSRGRRLGLRSEIAGVLTRSTEVRAQLGFFARWDKNLPRVNQKYESDASKVLTAAGRAAAAERIRTNSRARAASERAFKRFIKRDPSNTPGARRAARDAAKSVRQDALSRGASS